jgi:hypothetical protein
MRCGFKAEKRHSLSACLFQAQLHHCKYKLEIGRFVLNAMKEQKDKAGKVTAWTLNLNAEQTEKLIQLIER